MTIRLGISFTPYSRAIVALAFLVSWFVQNASYAAPLDFNEDDLSDIVWTSAVGTGLTWKAVDLDDQSTLDEAFGAPTDLPVPGYWNSSDSPSLCLIRPRAQQLTWKLLVSDGVLNERSFGKPGATVIAGADFDGNGLVDAATVTVEGNRLRWQVAFNLFGSKRSTKSFLFGNKGDRALAYSQDGERDKLAVFGRGTRTSGSPTLRIFDTRSKRETRLGTFPSGLADAPRPRPIALRQEAESDFLVFATQDETDTRLQIFNSKGQRRVNKVFTGLANASVGEFDLEQPGYEVAMVSSATLRIFNPKTKVVVEKRAPNPIIQDAIAVFHVSSSSTSSSSEAISSSSASSSSSSSEE